MWTNYTMKTKTKRKIRRARKRKNKTKKMKGGKDTFNSMIEKSEEDWITKSLDNSDSAVYATSVAITTLAATGVGLPVSGILAGLLVATSVFMRYVVINKRLTIILYDVMQIALKGYILYNLIDYSFAEFQADIASSDNQSVTRKYNRLPTIKDIDIDTNCEASHLKNTRNVRCIKLDEDIKKALFIKIKDLFALLLSIMPQEGFDIVQNELLNRKEVEVLQAVSNLTGITNVDAKAATTTSDKPLSDAIAELINKEDNARKQYRGFSQMNRMYSRFADSREVRTQIISYSTIINGYFMILNTQYQFSLDYFKAVYPYYDAVMDKIHKSDAFLKYLVPPPVQVSNDETTKSNGTDSKTTTSAPAAKPTTPATAKTTTPTTTPTTPTTAKPAATSNSLWSFSLFKSPPEEKYKVSSQVN